MEDNTGRGGRCGRAECDGFRIAETASDLTTYITAISIPLTGLVFRSFSSTPRNINSNQDLFALEEVVGMVHEQAVSVLV